MSRVATEVGGLGQYKPYPAYKDSGVGWLGTVPAEWRVQRLKRLADVRLSNVDKLSVAGELPVRLCNYMDVYRNERITGLIPFMSATATGSQIRRFALRVGDVLITKDSETPDDIAVPAVVAEELPEVLCGYHLALIRPSGVQGSFLARTISAIGVRDQFHVSAKGVTRFGLSGDEIGSTLIPLPEPDEQRAIVAFLNRENARIDALVAKHDQLISLLRERGAAIIARAVTRGLDSGVPMCDSGISSLGDIPTHWRVKRLKRITGRVDVGIAEAATHAYADEGVPMIRTTNVRPNQLLLDDLVHVESWFAATHRSKELFAGDLVTVRTGVPGTTAVVPRELNRSQCFTMLMATPRESQVPEFLSYYLNSGAARVYFEIEGLGTAQTNISVPILQQIQIPVPPKHEQHAIVTHIALEMARIERAVLKVELGIELLRESRAALMTAAVTGEIDVREEVA